MHLLKAISNGMKTGACPAPINPNPIIKKNILLNIPIIGAKRKHPKEVLISQYLMLNISLIFLKLYPKVEELLYKK